MVVPEQFGHDDHEQYLLDIMRRNTEINTRLSVAAAKVVAAHEEQLEVIRERVILQEVIRLLSPEDQALVMNIVTVNDVQMPTDIS